MEIKSKEEILKEHYDRFVAAHPDGSWGEWDKDLDSIEIGVGAMDQYSEQREKELLKWLREELFITKDPDEIYNLYKQSIKK